jgi:hypothetical protein
LEPAASYQHIEFFYIVRKHASINQESAIQKISSARSKILRVTRVSKKLGDLMQSNKAVMRRCVAAFFFVFVFDSGKQIQGKLQKLGHRSYLA